MAKIEIENLSFTYAAAKEPALRDVSLSIESGELLLVMGASGSGKSTLLSLLKPELAPVGRLLGNVRVEGGDTVGAVGFVMQDPEAQIVTDKVWHELAFGPENMGLSQQEIARRIADVGSYFHLGAEYGMRTEALSGGRKQILNLASVMAMRPEVLVLDEPTARLDPQAAREFCELLARINRELGVTVIVAEHNAEYLLEVCDRVLVLEQGAAATLDGPRSADVAAWSDRLGLPCAMRLFAHTGGTGTCPITVREGQKYYATLVQKSNAGGEDRCRDTERSADEPVLKAKDLWFRYEKDAPDVVRGASLTLLRGEIVCLLGGNATGKSTFLSLLTGVQRPYRGSVTGGAGNRRKQMPTVACLPQSVRDLFVKDTVESDLAYVLRMRGVGKEECRARVQEALAAVDAECYAARNPFDLSGGEQQRVALAKLLMLSPDVLLLDEPTKGLDLAAKQALCELLRRRARQGTAILLVTHDTELAAGLADRIVLWFDGRAASNGTPHDFFTSNLFCTTPAARIAAPFGTGAVTVEELVGSVGHE